MEQLEDDHMRLPPPASGNANANGNGIGTGTSSANTNANTSADSYSIFHEPSHQHQQHQHQHMHMQAHSHSLSASLLPPPFKNCNNNSAAATAIATTTTTISSSLSSRPPASVSASASASVPVPAYSPPSYSFSQQNTDPSTLNFPNPPSTELAPLQFNAQTDHAINSLPSLALLTGAPTSSSRRFPPSYSTTTTADSRRSYSPPTRPRAWPTGNPYSAYYAPGHGQADSPMRMDMDTMSNGTRGPLSPDTMAGRASSVSLDDPDVRMAAEALGDLRAGECSALYLPCIPTSSVSPARSPVHMTDMPNRPSDFVSSPQNRNTPMPTSPPNNFGTPGPPDPEPLLSLVMTSGSLLAKPIEGTVSAYNTTKNFSPGFIKTPVEYVEGVVGSGLHLSGIEGGVRWFFRAKGRHQSSSDLEAGENSHKRRKVDGRGGISASAPRRDAESQTVSDPYGFPDKDRRLSMSTVDSLPAYDDLRSPAYSENAMTTPNEKMTFDHTMPTASHHPSPHAPTAWQSRLIMSTSGLSIAMSEESLRSLKYCLSWLRWANEHIGRVIKALKDEIERYDATAHSSEQDRVMSDVGVTTTENSEQARLERGARIAALRKDILKTLQGVIETVSKYAGGALPDNARVLVRKHLTSLPQRFRHATQESGSGSPSPSSSAEDGKENEIREGAQRVMVLAKEGLDMMAQVSSVLDGTIISAEEWCERLGKKKREERGQGQTQGQQQQTVPLSGVGIDGDVKMGGDIH